MKNIIIFLLVFFFSVYHAHSQQLFTTVGFQQNNVSWTVGEIVFGSTELANIIVAQGFYDPYEPDPSGIVNVPSAHYSVYPNPVVDKLYIKTDQEAPCSLVLTDMLGRTLIQSNTASNQPISVSDLKSGQYILRIIGNQTAASFVIIKK
jgi:Secretion system C-terminal sorting domain